METPGNRQGVWGPICVQKRGWKKWKGLRDPESSGQGPPACLTWILTLEAGQIGVLRFGFQQVWQPGIAVPKPAALEMSSMGGQWVGATLPSSQPQPPPSSQAYPPEPHQDPVGLGPGPLLIGSQEAPHHGDAPTRARRVGTG